MVFSACKVSHVCRGIKTSPMEGTYLLDTSENSQFRQNLSEDLQQRMRCCKLRFKLPIMEHGGAGKL
jgi:hypothetical protein